MGEYADAVLLTTGQDAEKALSLLESDRSGRASLLPLDQLTPFESLKAIDDTDCLGIAADLVTAPAELQPAVDLLLGEVFIVRDRKAAKRILAGQTRNAKSVTLRGEVFFATGQVVAGKQTKTSALSRPRQRRELQESLAAIERQIAVIDSDLRKLSGQFESARDEVNARQELLGKEHIGLELARSGERQAQVREESARRQHEWQVNQKTVLEDEILLAEKERGQAVEALSKNSQEMYPSSGNPKI